MHAVRETVIGAAGACRPAVREARRGAAARARSHSQPALRGPLQHAELGFGDESGPELTRPAATLARAVVHDGRVRRSMASRPGTAGDLRGLQSRSCSTSRRSSDWRADIHTLLLRDRRRSGRCRLSALPLLPADERRASRGGVERDRTTFPLDEPSPVSSRGRWRARRMRWPWSPTRACSRYARARRRAGGLARTSSPPGRPGRGGGSARPSARSTS